jgi:hypothetical protein
LSEKKQGGGLLLLALFHMRKKKLLPLHCTVQPKLLPPRYFGILTRAQLSKKNANTEVSVTANIRKSHISGSEPGAVKTLYGVCDLEGYVGDPLGVEDLPRGMRRGKGKR